MKESMIEFNETKSSWVKRNGKWLKPLKLVGYEYDGNTNILTGSTRSGKRLELKCTGDITGIDGLVRLTEALRKQQATEGKVLNSISDPSSNSCDFKHPDYKSEFSWMEMFKSKIAGFISSRVNMGSFSMNQVKQCFEMSYKHDSLIDHVYQDPAYPSDISIHNSTSFAAKWLIKKLTKIENRKTNRKLIKRSKPK
jgi:hypothetical protein